MELFDYEFFRNALIGITLIAVASSVIGTYIFARRLVAIAGGITHACFGGLGLGYFTGINPILMAGVFAVGSSVGVEWMSSRHSVREDSAIAVVWSLGMAAGVLFVFLTPGYVPELNSFLFGNILTISQADLWAFAIFTVLLLAFVATFYSKIVICAFDRDFARSRGIPTRVISYVMAALIAVTIVLSIRIMGIVLLISLLTMPMAIVNSLSRSYRTIALCAPLVAVAGNVAGLVASYNFEVPPGAAIIFTLTLTLIVVKLLPLRQKKAGAAA